MIKTPEVSVTIPMRDGYLPYKDWLKLPNKAGKWTVDVEHNLDILTLGECKSELSETYTPNMMKKDRQDTIIAGALTDNTNRAYLQHWRVMS